jgi:iron complex transport system substrate-binding protein
MGIAVVQCGAAAPQRVVSLCGQGDQLALQLLDRPQIAALSRFAADPDISPHWEAARGIPTTQGEAEALVQLHPDLVLAGAYSLSPALDLLQRRGVPVLRLGVPNDFEELRAQLREAGRAFHAEARAEAVIAAMDARLARIAATLAPPAERPGAIFCFQDGFVPSASTFPNALLEAAGYRNQGAALGHQGAALSLERLLMERPAYLFLAPYRADHPTATQAAPGALLRRLSPQTVMVQVPFRHLSCPDPSNLDLVEALIAARSSAP